MNIVRIVAGLMLFLAIVGTGSQPVVAQDICNNRVSDEFNLLGDTDIQVNTLAEQLVQLGADIHIVVVKSFNLPRSEDELERFYHTLLATCPAWEAKNKLLVFASLEEARGAIYYGSDWKDELSSSYLPIVREHMNPLLQKQDVGAGMISGLTEVTTLLNRFRWLWTIMIIAVIVIFVIVILIGIFGENGKGGSSSSGDIFIFAGDAGGACGGDGGGGG